VGFGHIYGWWPDKNKPPVLVFSTKGLGLPPKGALTDRAIANVTVSAIAGYLMDIDSHEKGKRDCPNYYNPDRELRLLAGRQKFCKPCSNKISRSHPQEFKALNAILKAFE
jgi:hypothetical protein